MTRRVPQEWVECGILLREWQEFVRERELEPGRL